MNNPVAWQLWGPEALELAKKSNRLIFISIGYAACHCNSFGSPRWITLSLPIGQGVMSWSVNLLRTQK